MSGVISIVAPAYNEEQNLPEFLRRLDGLSPALQERGLTLEVVIVDDHSRDGTPEAMALAIKERANLKYVRLARNCGPHSAVAAGLKFCTGDCAVVMAVDLQDPPEIVPRLFDCQQQGYDVVWACRSHREGESLATRLASQFFYRTMRLLAMPEMPKKGADFLLISRQVIDAFNEISEKHTSVLAMIVWMGFRQTSIDYVKQVRHTGKSKWTLAKKIKLFIDSVVSFSYVPIRVMSLLGVLMASAGFLYAFVVVVGRLLNLVAAGTGFAAIMTVLLVGQGCILTMLGILGEYLWRTYDEARGRPRYIIERYLTSDTAHSTRHVEERPS
jgi:glycosyltransferase involved in cell wall biosynthesis